MEDLETLQLELESLLYGKGEIELKQFAKSIGIKKDVATLSKIVVLKTIQKELEERIHTDGEMAEKVEWFKKYET